MLWSNELTQLLCQGLGDALVQSKKRSRPKTKKELSISSGKLYQMLSGLPSTMPGHIPARAEFVVALNGDQSIYPLITSDELITYAFEVADSMLHQMSVESLVLLLHPMSTVNLRERTEAVIFPIRNTIEHFQRKLLD